MNLALDNEELLWVVAVLFSKDPLLLVPSRTLLPYLFFSLLLLSKPSIISSSPLDFYTALFPYRLRKDTTEAVLFKSFLVVAFIFILGNINDPLFSLSLNSSAFLGLQTTLCFIFFIVVTEEDGPIALEMLEVWLPSELWPFFVGVISHLFSFFYRRAPYFSNLSLLIFN